MKKIKKAKSDSEPIPDNLKLLEKKPEALNLLTIYSELSQNNLEKTLQVMAGKEYSFLKNFSFVKELTLFLTIPSTEIHHSALTLSTSLKTGLSGSAKTCVRPK